MLMLGKTGRLCGALVKVQDQDSWNRLELRGCVVVGGPAVHFSCFDHVTFLNCTFLYDGMEVAGSEWVAFMSQERVARSVRPQRGVRRL